MSDSLNQGYDACLYLGAYLKFDCNNAKVINLYEVINCDMNFESKTLKIDNYHKKTLFHVVVKEVILCQNTPVSLVAYCWKILIDIVIWIERCIYIPSQFHVR